MDTSRFIDALNDLEPVELKGVELLRRLRSDNHEWFPGDGGEDLAMIEKQVSRIEVTEATLELISYGDSCRKLLEKVQTVEAVPLTVPLAEYPL